MGEFLMILSFYYLCNSAAEVRPLGPEELHRCSESYETVKYWFRPDWEMAAEGSAARAGQNREAYLAFKGWEAAHPALVATMQAEAAARARGLDLALR